MYAIGTDILISFSPFHQAIKKTATDSLEPMAVLKNPISAFGYIGMLIRTHGHTGMHRLTGSQATGCSALRVSFVCMARIIIGRQGMSMSRPAIEPD